ncbi:glucose repression mediator protein [Cryomyces antarcticus]|nr:glucose repression mediator protein [Cryomyces antarcticus]
MHPLHGPPPGHPQTNGHTQLQQSQPKNASQYLTQANEAMWLQLGQVSELMGELDSAILSYEHAMLFNQWSVPAMQAISGILRTKDQFPAAVEYLKQIIKVESSNGDVWSSLGTSSLNYRSRSGVLIVV